MNVRVQGRTNHFRTVSYDPETNAVLLVEQRLLPHEFKLFSCRDYPETAKAIRDMIVRGAGAIGATAAFGLAQGAKNYPRRDLPGFQRHIERVYETLKAARPTAVDPVNAMDDVRRKMAEGRSVLAQQGIALEAARHFADDQVAECRTIGRHGSRLIRDRSRILTHCNAGWLAFVDIGSATSPLYAAQAEGKTFHVYCDETRPRLQGATLTAWELAQKGISHEIIADNAAGHLIQQGQVDLVIVGSDRTLGRTGEVANKIGTYTKAVLARRHRIPFYVAIPLSTIDWRLRSGRAIPIEEREPAEVLGAWGISESGKREYVRLANPASTARNPGFDVTPPDLITGIITPRGIFKPRELWARRRELQSS